MDNYLDQDLRIINPFNFAKSLLVQWRAVVALGLIIGILVMMAKYASDCKAVKTDPVSTTVDTQTEKEVLSDDISEVSESLSLAERGQVYQALAYYREIKSYENYVANSIYMNMDALDFKTVKVRYKIQPAEGVEVADVVSAYEYYFKSKEVLESIANELEPGVEPEFFGEILSVEQSGTGYMIVSMALYDPDKRDAITEVITNTVSSGEKEISDLAFQTTYISDMLEKSVDSSLMYNQVQYMKTYAQSLASIEGLSGKLTNMQKQLYNLEMKRQYGEVNPNDLLDIVSVEEIIEPEGENAVTTLRPSPTYFILGFLVGIVIYVVLYLLKVLFFGRLSEMEIERETTLPVLGVLEVPANKTNKVLRALFFDSFVYKRVFGDQAQKRNLENAVALMMNRCGGRDCHKIQVLQLREDLSSKGRIEEFIDAAKHMGVEVIWKSVDPSSVKDVVSKIENDIPAVISAEIWKTKKTDIKKLFGMMQNQNVNVLGELHIECF